MTPQRNIDFYVLYYIHKYYVYESGNNTCLCSWKDNVSCAKSRSDINVSNIIIDYEELLLQTGQKSHGHGFFHDLQNIILTGYSEKVDY